ncbi:hypothetical protein [Sporosarcina sp. ANT_H38]
MSYHRDKLWGKCSKGVF